MPTEATPIRIDQQVFQQTLDRKLADLPPLPAVVTRIMETVNDPNTSADDLNRLISLDQGLSSKMLRIVNSSYYGFPKRISTITHAVVILGFNTVRNLVLGVSAFGMLSRKGGAPGLNRDKFWQHSVASAVAAGVVARRTHPRNRALVEQAFLGGLLHDIGELFLDCHFPIQYVLTTAHASREGMGLIATERELLQVDHAAIGKRIAELWNFPPSLVAAVGGWYEPDPASELFDCSAIVSAADWLAWQAGFGSSDRMLLPELPACVREWMSLKSAELDEIVLEVQSQFTSACELLNLNQAA